MTVLTLQKNSLHNATASAKNKVLLVSCYELGHQPAGLAMPLGFLRCEGIEADTLDVSVEGFEAAKVMNAKFVGISVPMHTALRLGVAIAQEVRRINPDCHICFYGLYASLNGEYLLATIADSIIGGEFEAPLVELIQTVLANPADVKTTTTTAAAAPVLVRLNFAKPERRDLPALSHYARLDYRGEQQLVGYVEASRGCLHHCTHCPIPPVYEGRFFIVPVEVVLQDIHQLVAAGAQHITFGDPDFLNGPTHALRLVRAMHEEFPQLTFDCTVKVEHIIKHENRFAEFANCGCIFVVSAVESLSDKVLHHLEKGHTRADVFTGLRILRDAGIALRPSLVSFTPWTTLDDFLEVLDFVEAENLIDALDPVQYSIRLLVPPGSMLLQREEIKAWLGQLNQQAFTYEWQHPDPRMDDLHKQVAALVERAAQTNEDTVVTFYRLRDLVNQLRGAETASLARAHLSASRRKPPRLTEAWFC